MLLLPAGAFAVLTIASAVLGAGAPFVTAPAAEVQAYSQAHRAAVAVQATVLFASAFPLAVWAAVAREHLRRLGVTVLGPTIGWSGGLLAAGGLAASGLASWASAQPVAAGVEGALRSLAFAAGAAGFVVPLGLLLAGAAVPAMLARLLPRWLTAAGLVVAGVCVLATFTLIWPELNLLLPAGRFGGLLWLVAASVLLDRRVATA